MGSRVKPLVESGGFALHLEADELFVFKSLIFNTSAIVLHEKKYCFNVAQPACNNTRFVYRYTLK